MAIPPAGSPPPAPNFADLVRDDDSTFEVSLGNWTNTGGTLTRDTSYKFGYYDTASLKLVTTGNHYVTLSIPGAFKVGAEYVAFIAVSLEEDGLTAASFFAQFGVFGTDEAPPITESGMNPSINNYGFAGGDSNWSVVGLRWKPTATRTSVQLRVGRPDPDSGNTQTWHIGLVKVFRLPVPDGPASITHVITSGYTTSTFYAPSQLIGSHFLGWSSGGGVYGGGWGRVGMQDAKGKVGVDLGLDQNYLWSEHTPGDLSGAGVDIEAGDDYVGLYVSEKDSNTVQMYADTSGGYMMQLRHRGSGKGWAVSPDGTINGRIEAYFQWEFYVSGTLSSTTNVGAYFQTPNKAYIEEVRCHVGTAPTGQAILVDVNDDGTTIFTTQGNRPSIAASTTDATSGAADGGTAVAKDSVITIDIDQVGSGTAGSNLAVFVRGYYVW